MISVSLDVAVTTSGWPDSFGGPALMPVSVTFWVGASSLSGTGLGVFSVGGSLIGLTATVKVRVTLLLWPWPSLTVTVMRAVPNALATGLKVNRAVLSG